eukprot:458669-Ditylum_brightwellii.AAC.1
MGHCMVLVKHFSNDIGMMFGLPKCAVLSTHNGEVNCLEITLKIPHLDEDDSYYYLGIMESTDFLTEKFLTCNIPVGGIDKIRHQNAKTVDGKRIKGGGGLIGLEDTHRHECTTLIKYILNANSDLTKIIKHIPTSIQCHILKYADVPHCQNSEQTDDFHIWSLKRCRSMWLSSSNKQ